MSASGKRRVVLIILGSPMEPREHAAELALRLENELASFARRAMAGGRRGNEMHAVAHVLGRLARRAGETAAREHRQGDDVVAPIGAGRALHLQLAPKRGKSLSLVVGALHHVLDAELLGALLDGLRPAATDDRGLQA